jgi:hypothetical protein
MSKKGQLDSKRYLKGKIVSVITKTSLGSLVPISAKQFADEGS